MRVVSLDRSLCAGEVATQFDLMLLLLLLMLLLVCLICVAKKEFL